MSTVISVVQRADCNGRTLSCINCGEKLGRRHWILCYLYAQKRQAASPTSKEHTVSTYWTSEKAFAEQQIKNHEADIARLQQEIKESRKAIRTLRTRIAECADMVEYDAQRTSR